MAASLESCLQVLHSLLQQPISSSKEQIEVIIEDLKTIAQQDAYEKDFDYTCALLFDKEKGITKFLLETATLEELQNGKASALDLLSSLIQKGGRRILVYALDIKEACLSVYSCDRFAKVKNAAIPALVKLLEVSVGSAMGEDLKINKMIEKFFTELTKASKLAASVKAGIYHLLGVIAEVYPDLMAPYSARLAGLYVSALKAEMTAKTRKPELSIIAGCLDGLCAFMVNFTQSADEDSKHSYDIFKYTRMAIDPKVTYTRYEVPRAGLRVIAKHAEQFRQYLMDDYEAMYDKLQSWSHHNNRDLLHLGISALDSFMKEVCTALVEKAEAGNKEGGVFKFFLLTFRNIMNDSKSTSKEVSTAIRGYGMLAAPCRSFLSESDTQFMFAEMISKCEHQFLNQDEELEDRLMSIPSYMNALSCIIRQIDSVSASHALVLEHLVIVLIENFSSVAHKQQFVCIRAILLLLLTLMKKVTVFQNFLSAIVYQGLIRTCSHPIVVETSQYETSEYDGDPKSKPTSYKDFMPLWSGLLDSSRFKELANEGFIIADRNLLTETVYNEFMVSSMKILSKLDLEASSGSEENEESNDNQQEITSADPVFGVTAKKPIDFQIFINLVDLCRDLLVNNHRHLFSSWVYVFCHSMIVMSSKHPLVSGLYKLLAIAMMVSNKIHYFEGCGNEAFPSESAHESMDVDMPFEQKKSEKEATYQLVMKFSKEVLVRMKQYRDDLLASCLTFILAMPKEIVCHEMNDIVTAIQMTFTIGLSYLPLAQIGLDALEFWSEHLPKNVIQPYYKDILPTLDPYLKSDVRGTNDVKDASVVEVTKKSKRRTKMPVRLVKETKVVDDKNSETLLSQVKKRILTYLGSLGGQINHDLLALSDSAISEEAIAWDTENHLRFDVPFFDMKPTIYFDPFLPHVVQLAEQSSDRQTKVAACELLHSLVLYSLGRGVQLSREQQQRHPMEKLYRKIFPSLLSLACDVEQVCKDLFEPLVLQLIHWFTNNKMAESPEAMALLDTIYDGLIQNKDTALRDFSAKCLKEFLQWSLKQATKKAVEKNPINAKSVLKRMYSFALHPNAFKRLGAALAFNNIYMVFREENSLVDRFTFEILHHFVESLAMAHRDPKSLGTQEQCSKALNHLERIMKVKADILKKDPGAKARPEPSSWSSRKMEFAVRWLTGQCGRPETECRHVCMRLVFNLCTLLPGLKVGRDYFGTLFKAKGAPYFLERFEGGGHGSSDSHGLRATPTLEKIKKPLTVLLILQWFESLLAALDCYCWIFGEDLLTPSQIFTGKGSDQSHTFESVIFFLEKVSFCDLTQVMNAFKKADTTVFTPSELEEFSRAKCTVIIRMWNFLSICLAKHSGEVIKVFPKGMWNKMLWQLLVDCILRPTAVGFNMADTEIMQKLPKEMSFLLTVLSKFLPKEKMTDMKESLKIHLKENCNIHQLLPIDFMALEVDQAQLGHLANGYTQLINNRFLDQQMLTSIGAKDLSMRLLDNVYNGIVESSGSEVKAVKMTPVAKTIANSLLTLALQMDVPPQQIVKRIMAKAPVQTSGSKVSVNQGDLFFHILKSTLLTYITGPGRDIITSFMDVAKEESSSVSTILIAVLEHMARDRTLRKKEGTNMCNLILSQWKKLESWWDKQSTSEMQSLALMVLTKILLIDSQVSKNEKHGSFEAVFDMYLAILVDTRTSLGFKTRALDLLPFFGAVTKGYEDRLKSTLNRFVADNFPLQSSEFAVGTPKHNDYIMAIKKLLVAMEMSGSLVLLELVISVLCREAHHVYETEIQESISNFIQRLQAQNQKPALDIPYSIFAKEGGFPSNIRRSAIEKVCLPMIRLAQTSSIIEFFSDHIHKLIDILDGKLKSSESALDSQLINKLSCFQLLEVMYSRLGKDEVNSKTSLVNQTFCHGKVDTGKEMTMRITKAAQEAKSEDVRGETMLLELRRQYHCHAYNLLISIISCVQTDLKFYKGFLFQDNTAKGQFLIDNIINKEKVYEFQSEFQSPLQRRQKFVAMRKEAKEKKEGEEGSGSSPSSVTPFLHLASQYLAGSSLSDDLSQYDFNQHTSGQSYTFGSGIKKQPKRQTSDEPEDVEASETGNFLELEMDALNEHECMTSLVGVFRHIVSTGISPQVPKGTSPSEMPVWMSYFHDKMKNPTTHINVKLFIAKVAQNCSKIFQPYAKFWFRPLCQLLFAPEVSGGGVTYFVVDLIVSMLSWHTTAIPEDSSEERSMASRVVKFVMSNVYHSNRQIFRNNLDLLKTLLECWHDRVEIPYDIVHSLFKVADPRSDRSATGVQVLGVVLATKFPAYGPSAPVEMERYLNSFANLMGHHLKSVHAAAAEVVGLVLHRLAESQKETEGPFHDHIDAHLSGFAQAKPDVFITCVHGIHKQYPAFTKRFLSKLLFMLPNLHGEFRTLCLEIIQGHVSEVENAFLELGSKGLVNFLTHRNEECQLVSLKIVKSMMTSLKNNELLTLLPSITAFSSHSNAACRMVALEILMWVFDNYRNDEGEIGSKIMMQTKEALLLALCDDDVACRLVCQNFWSSNTRLSESTLDRTVSMLEAMYSPNTEVHFLAYATNLLLEATSKSPDYQRFIFEHPLSDCKFEEYPVRSSWHQRHAVMTPLFAATLYSQSMNSDESEESMEEGIRATQDAQQFTATMDVAAGSGKAFNWLTQSSMDTFTESSSVRGDSQLLFKVGASSRAHSKSKAKDLPSREKKVATARVASTSRDSVGSTDATNGEGSSSSDIWRLKKRFLKDKDVQSRYFALRQVHLRKMREEAVKEQRARRENQVTLYRKYRSGDLPDIQIKYQYVIAPLQALANRDNKVAKLLFSSLFTSIFDQLDQEKTEREMEEVIGQVKKSLENIFHQSVHYFPHFIGSILNVLYNLKSTLKVSSNDLVTSAIVSGQQNLGILVLEEQLIHVDPKMPTSSKRGKYSAREPEVDTAKWIELSRLYKSVREVDALQGVFSDKINTKAITRKAIEAEAAGDYKAARQLYEEAASCTTWPDGDPLESEIDFWDDSRMECLNALCQWHDLESVSVMGLDPSNEPNLDCVWEDAFCQEHYLPYVMRSKLKLLLDGDTNQQPLLTFVDAAMVDEAKKQHLQSRFCEELALMSIWQEDYGRARYYANLAFDGFMQDWISTSAMMTSNRKKRLCQLQTLVEMQEFLTDISSERLSSAKLFQKWENRSPHPLLNPVDVWDDIVTNRSVYLDLLNKRTASQSGFMDSLEAMDTDEITDKVEEMQVKLRLAMADSCLHQNNVAVTLKLLKSCHSTCKRLDNPHSLAMWVFLYSRTHHTKAHNTVTPWTEETFKNVVTTLDQLTKLEENTVSPSPDLQVSNKVYLGRAFDTLIDGVLGLDNLDLFGEYTLAKLKKRADWDGDPQKLVNELIAKGYEYHKAAVAVDDFIPENHTKFCVTVEQANLDLAKYCDKYLRLQEDERLPDRCSLKDFPETTVVCLLNAIKGGSLEGRQRFPRLLQIASLYPSVQDQFISKVKQTPCWMFLMWVSQMTALMDKSEASVVAPILLSIGEQYPQALVYPFCMSFEGLKFGKSAQDKQNKQTVERLARLIDSSMVYKFICALEQFTQPDMIFKDWADEMRKMITGSKKVTDEIKKSYKKMYNALLNTNQSAPDTLFSESSTSSSVPMGDYRKNFATKFKAEFDKCFGSEGTKLLTMTSAEFKKVTEKMSSLFGPQKGGAAIPTKVKEYSTWMADFTFNKIQNLEIPGQYTGLQKPMPEYHVYVAGFHERVLVMTSLRKPKRIIIRGNDEREHPYLVKGGEDLRMDQRIETLFFIMNKVMSADPICSQRKLQLTTYQVVPMTPRVGLIEWMSNTCPLKDFLNNSLTEEENKYIDGPQGPKRTYNDWTTKVEQKGANWQKVYDAVCSKYSQTDTIREFRIREGKIPWDLSRRSLHKISSSPEAFHVLRSTMVSTHATICICQYLLGIGDRHLSNFLVNLKTGQMVGIDFGHNFGTATQFLPVPELIPFRLTRQLINLNLPMQIKGLMEGTMRHVLRALRNDWDLLFSTMDIFVKEPSVDWLSFADKQMQFTDSKEGGENWYPKQKVEFAKRKLIGDHPSHIMKHELTFSSHSKRPVFKYFTSLVIGNEKEHVRTKLPEHGLTVEQQVAALIDQATDPNILGRTWIGWEAWV